MAIGEPGNLLEEKVDSDLELGGDFVPVDDLCLGEIRNDVPQGIILGRLPVDWWRVYKVTSRERKPDEDRVGRVG